MPKPKLGVVLFQLGGPDSAEAVEPFLYNMFCDPDIINFRGASLARRPLAWYIAHKRAPMARERYNAIGGRSPIRLLTERQGRRLEARLSDEFDARCWVAMRYWHPLTAEAAAAVRAAQLDALVLLPLYPHYSFATTLSSLKEWKRHYDGTSGPAAADRPPSKLIEDFHTHPLYIQAVVERIESALSHFDDPSQAHFVFSAHGLPLSLVEKGDPYPRQVEEMVAAVRAEGGWKNGATLCYQSRVGRQKWLQPSLVETLPKLAAAGEKHLLVVPVSFVTEHVETLHEVNIEARELAMEAGVEQFEMMPAVGDSPVFIEALADLVRGAARSLLPKAAQSSARG